MAWFFQRNEKWPTHVGEEYEPNDEEYENNDHAAGGAAKAPQRRHRDALGRLGAHKKGAEQGEGVTPRPAQRASTQQLYGRERGREKAGRHGASSCNTHRRSCESNSKPIQSWNVLPATLPATLSVACIRSQSASSSRKATPSNCPPNGRMPAAKA